MTTIAFAKGHGTQNDFVILQDEQARLYLTPELIRAICDRRTGIGGDGILRVARVGALVRAGIIAQPEGVKPSMWFMDYRNADGSEAEMCGNGLRVFAHWLCSRGLVQQTTFDVATRAGVKHVIVDDCTQTEARVTVELGQPVVGGVSSAILGGKEYFGVNVNVGNPHLACIVEDLTKKELDELPVGDGFDYDRSVFPEGVNLEIATELDEDNHVFMRVHERGAGETRACGTGTVAVAKAALIKAGLDYGTVDVTEPGGDLQVRVHHDYVKLVGPSVIFAAGLMTEAALGVEGE